MASAGSIASLTGKKTGRVDVTKILAAERILAYDLDNSYPQRILYTLAASATGTACVNLLAKHIAGAGFKDLTFAIKTVNRYGLTANQLLKKLAADYSKFKSFAVAVVYNAFGEPVELLHIPVEQVRYTLADDWGYIQKLAVYDDWDRKKKRSIDKSKIYYLDRFDPRPAVVSKQIENAGGFNNWNGQIFYYSDSFPEYPLATCDPVFRDVETDGLIQVFRNRAVGKGFMPNGMLAHPGKFENQTKRDEFVESMQQFQGADQSNSILLVEYDTPEMKPEFLPMTYPDVDKVFDLTETRTRDSIIMAYSQPPILLGVQVAGKLGSTNERNEAKIQYDEITAEERATFGDRLGYLFNLIPKLGTKEANYNIVPISDAITMGGASLFGALGPDAITKVLEIIKDTALGPDQKAVILAQFYNISAEKSKLLIQNDGAKPL
jgi:hypothetical protein